MQCGWIIWILTSDKLKMSGYIKGSKIRGECKLFHMKTSQNTICEGMCKWSFCSFRMQKVRGCNIDCKFLSTSKTIIDALKKS